MVKVGVRELRHRLREVLLRAEAGESFEVTSFGRTVAHLVPAKSGQSVWERLVAEGKLTPPTIPDSSRLPQPRPASRGRSATEALLQERRKDVR
jgi:prevent-host-death family protein